MGKKKGEIMDKILISVSSKYIYWKNNKNAFLHKKDNV